MAKKEGIFSRLFSRLKGGEEDTKKSSLYSREYENTPDFYVTVIKGDEKGRIFELSGAPVFIGKHKDILTITDNRDMITEKQARIFWNEHKKSYVIDRDESLKPTVVDGTVITKETILKNRSQIIIGQTVIEYRGKDISAMPDKSDRQDNFDDVNRLFDGFSSEISDDLPEKKTCEEGGDEETGTEEKYMDDAMEEEPEEIRKFESGYILEVISGIEEGRRFVLDRPIISIGKLTAMDRHGWILLDTSSISADQATLKWMDKYKKFAILHTRDAITPTLVNDRAISDREFTLLRTDDIIRTGNIKMVIKYKGENRTDFEEERPEYSSPGFSGREKDSGDNAGRASESSVRREYLSKGFSGREKDFRDSIHKRSETYARREYSGSRLPGMPREPEKSIASGAEHQKFRDYSKPETGTGKKTVQDETLEVSFKEGHMFQVVGGPDRDRAFTISKAMVEKKLVIGRKGRVRKDIEIADDSMLDSHASLTFEDIWLILNLEDQEGEILVNGLSVIKKGLEDGDVIKIGNTVIEHYLVGSNPAKGATLEMTEGFREGLIIPVKKKQLLIGRKSDDHIKKDIEFPEDDRTVSRQHCRIDKKGNKFYLINQKSKNMTLLNGILVTEPRPLVNGDNIQIGNSTVFLFKCFEPPLVVRDKPREIKKTVEEKVIILDYKVEDKKTSAATQEMDSMILIPGGKFYMGTNQEGDSSPGHTVHVDPFYIDRYAVTNSQYAEFVNNTGYKSEGGWEEYFSGGKEDYPVVGITYNDARAYGTWKGKRLPTEAEWEKAGRGEDGRLYPWGNEWASEKLCSKDGGEISSVYTYSEGASPYGVMNMLGSVWEWTGDHYGPYPYTARPVTDQSKEVVIRGGDFLTELKESGITIRAGICPDEYVDGVGFRCAKSAYE
ncbi:MAG: SUMF1/EgtB/PvdO family nonheme iron enzyme [Candidatus Eremiobacterota bacterium]